MSQSSTGPNPDPGVSDATGRPSNSAPVDPAVRVDHGAQRNLFAITEHANGALSSVLDHRTKRSAHQRMVAVFGPRLRRED